MERGFGIELLLGLFQRKGVSKVVDLARPFVGYNVFWPHNE